MKKKMASIFSLMLTINILLNSMSVNAIEINEQNIVEKAEKTSKDGFEYTFLDDGTVCITKYQGNDKDVNIPSQIEGINVTIIGGLAFDSCKSITSVIVPSTVTNINSDAFWGCTNLEKVVIQDGVKSIESMAFYNCINLKDVTLPNSLQKIGSEAFYNCINLKDIILPKSLQKIDDSAFAKCTSLKCINIPQNVSEISRNAFFMCSSLEEINISCNIKTIEDYTFQCCYNLKSIKIPNSVTCIKESAFSCCNNLSKVIILDNVKEIVDNAFIRTSDDCEIVFYGHKNTYAETYANKHNIKFVDLDDNSISNNNDMEIIGPTTSNMAPVNDDIPVFGGTDFTLQIGDYTCKSLFNTEEKTVKVLFGTGNYAKAVQEWGNGKSEQDYKNLKNNINKILQNNLSLENSYLKPEVGNNNSLYGSYYGYIELKADDKGMYTIPTDFGAYIEGAGKWDSVTYLPVPITIPVFVEATITAEGQAGISLVDNKTAQIRLRVNELKFALSANVSLELGVKGIASIGGYVGATGSAKFGCIDDENLHAIGGGLEIYGGITATVLGFKQKYKIAGVKLTYSYNTGNWERELTGGVSNGPDARSFKSLAEAYSDKDGYTRISNRNIQNDDNTIENRVVPSDSKCDIIELDNGRKLAVWIDEDNSRIAENNSKLVYSVYNGQAWSKVQSVNDDKRADYEPKLVKANDGVYLVWQKSSKELVSGCNLQDALNSIDIYSAKFDGNKFDNITQITNNNIPDTQIKATSKDSGIYISWINNSANDVLGNDGTDVVKYVSFDGTVSKENILLNNVKTIMDYDISSDKDNIMIAYSCDNDNDLSTSNDRNINVLVNGKSTDVSGSATMINSIPKFVDYKGQKVIFWYSDNKIKYSYLSNLNDKKEINKSINTDCYDIVTKDDKLMIVYKKNSDSNDESQKYATDYYGILYNSINNQWSNPIKLSSNANKINFNGKAQFDENNNLELMYYSSDLSNQDSYLEGTSNIVFDTINNRSNIEIYNPYVDLYKAGPNSTVNIKSKIINNGIKKLDNYSVKLLNENGQVISNNENNNGLCSGESLEIEIPYTISNSFDEKELRMIVSDGTGNVIAEKNVSLLYNDVQVEDVQLLYENKYFVKAKVKNNGRNNLDNVNVRIIQDSLVNGNILETKVINSIAVGESKEIEFEVNKDIIQKNKLLFAEVSIDKDESDYVNNDKYLEVQENQINQGNEQNKPTTPEQGEQGNKQDKPSEAQDGNQKNKETSDPSHVVVIFTLFAGLLGTFGFRRKTK